MRGDINKETRRVIESNPRLGFLHLSLASTYVREMGMKPDDAEKKAFDAIKGAPGEAKQLHKRIERMTLSMHEMRAGSLKKQGKKIPKPEGRAMQALQQRRRMLK